MEISLLGSEKWGWGFSRTILHNVSCFSSWKKLADIFKICVFLRLFLQGLPIFFLELAIGQRLRKGAIGVWAEVSPYLGGIGISSAIVSFIVALYYNTIIAWCLIYFLHSFENPLPWAECPKHFISSNMTYFYEKECIVRISFDLTLSS